MDQLLSGIPQLVKIIQEAGVIGLLVIIAAFLGYEVFRLRKENNRIYEQRDRARFAYVLYKQACDTAKIVVDTSALREFINEKGELA
jgi:hypothetical protein